MLKLYRMHKAVRVVNQRTRRIYSNPFFYGARKGLKLPTTEECMEAYKPWLVRDKYKRKRVVRRAFESAVANGYLLERRDASNTPYLLQVSPDKGEDFISMWFWGLFREALVKNKALISIATTTVAVGISGLALYISLRR